MPLINSDASGGGRRLTKNEKRRLKLKKKSAEVIAPAPKITNSVSSTPAKEEDDEDDDLNVVVEYVPADLQAMVEDDPAMAQFQEIFQKFSSSEELTVGQSTEEEDKKKAAEEEAKKLKESNAKESEAVVKPLSKKKKKLLSRLSVAELKQLVQRPDVVEAHDVTAADPRLLVYLKAYRNTVPVPRHWCHKRKYLQGKRGMEKPAFQLPGEEKKERDRVKGTYRYISEETLKWSKHFRG